MKIRKQTQTGPPADWFSKWPIDKVSCYSSKVRVIVLGGRKRSSLAGNMDV